MHFEILVEDLSGKMALDVLVHRILGNGHTYAIHAYKGIGRIPQKLEKHADASKRILLNALPKLLQGYGNTFANYPSNYPAAVILVCDLDDKDFNTFLSELHQVLHNCDPAPKTCFCIAIEEGEAWLLGDIKAVKKAYPNAKDTVLTTYKNDSICGTWEVLANAIYKGGAQALKAQGKQKVGTEKSSWARMITPHMDVDNNQSPSFCYFRNQLRELIKDTSL